MRLYTITLGRRPDIDGLNTYVSHLQDGRTLEQIAATFITSDEFLASAGDEPVSVVMYRNAHGAVEIPDWVVVHQAPEALAASLVRDQAVAERLPASPVYDQNVDPWVLSIEVVRLYLLILGRRPDVAGLAVHVEQRRSGAALEEIAAAFLASDEFHSQAGDEAPAIVLHRRAYGSLPPPNWVGLSNRPPEVVATAFLNDPAVARRLSVLDALHPDGIPLDDAVAYRRWLSELARPDATEHRAMLQDRSLPTVSWIVILNDPRPEWLAATIASVQAQHAPWVELLLVGRRHCATAVRYAQGDTRVRLVRGLPWEQQAKTFSRALAACHGEFVGVLGQHDILHETANFEIAQAGTLADVVTSDEDSIDEAGLRHSPRFGLNLRSEIWTRGSCHATFAVRTALARKAGAAGLRGLDGRWNALQTGELSSWIVSEAGPERVRHVPVLLRSRRQASANLKKPGEPAGKTHSWAPMREVVPGSTASGTAPLVSVIIATRDHASLLRACLEGVLDRTDYPALEVLVLDNGSREAEALTLLDRLGLDPRVRVLRCDSPFNWSALNNEGVREMRGEIAMLLNNDIAVTEPGWLRAMVAQALQPDVGLVGAKLLYSDRTVQHAGMVLGPAGRATHMWRHSDGSATGYMDQLMTVRDVSAVTGACIAMRRAVHAQVGGLEESLPVTWRDVDLSLRVRAAGLRVVWTPHAVLTHHEQATRGTDDTEQGQVRLEREKAWMLRRWGEAMDVDPFLSPNMLPSEARPLLAPVPRRVPPWMRQQG